MSKKSRRRIIRKSKKEILRDKFFLGLIIFMGVSVFAITTFRAFWNFPGPNIVSPTDGRLIRPDSQFLGELNAEVTIVEFVDLACLQCARFNIVLKEVFERHKGNVRIVFRHLPLQKNSEIAGRVLEAASGRGQFWEMENAILSNQHRWIEDNELLPAYFSEEANRLGLESSAFVADLKNPIYEWRIHRDLKDAESLGVRSAPAIFVNGERLGHATGRHLEFLVEKYLPPNALDVHR